MNIWTKRSIELANRGDYLDQLFRVYPIAPDATREVDKQKWDKIVKVFKNGSNADLIRGLLDLELFPIKDSYVAYLKRDRSAIDRNPATVNRLAVRLKEMGLDEIRERCSEPKETNRQIGPLFRRWLQTGSLGVPLVPLRLFTEDDRNAVLDGSDAELMAFATRQLGYSGKKGLDIVARFNHKYVIGEAKFLTDFGGHQNAQFQDAMAVLNETTARAVRVAILDGVLYIRNKGKMHRYLDENHDHIILSALLLRDFLNSL